MNVAAVASGKGLDAVFIAAAGWKEAYDSAAYVQTSHARDIANRNACTLIG